MRKPVRHVVVPLTLALLATVAAVSASQADDHTTLPAIIPTTATPNINDNDAMNNAVHAITRVGNDIVLGGIFQSATNPGSSTAIARTNILAFDAATGNVDPNFAPTLDDEVDALLPGPTAGTVYVGGKFSNVNGAAHTKLVELNLADGSVVTQFAPAALDGIVNDLAVTGSRLFLGGTFTKVGKIAHAGLATLNPTTGATDPFMNLQLAGHHNYAGVAGTANSGVGADRFDVSPDGSKLIVIGNFKTVAVGTGTPVAHDQITMVDLSGAAAAPLPFYAPEFTVACNNKAFDEWVRDVAFSPDGTYFVEVGTGGPFANTMCDSAARFETADANNTSAHSTWIDHSGGDTFLSVATTSVAIYVGGHFRWLNNSFGHDSAAAGAVGRASIAALDPNSGLPMAWNPGRDPRGFGIQALYVDPNGLYVGSDTDFMGYAQYIRQKIALLPFAGGHTPVTGSVVNSLPAKIYQAGVQAPLQSVLYRVNTGGPSVAATDGGPAWAADTASTPSALHNSSSTTIVTTAKIISKIDPSVPDGTPLDLFTDTRVDPTASPDMIWTFPVTAGAPVKVRLYFSDRSSPAYVPGQRVFNVVINGTTVDANFDIVGTAGYNTAVMREYAITPTTSSVVVDFQPVADKPELAAIEVVRDGTAGTGSGIGYRTFNGSTAGSLTPVVADDGTPWQNERGAFLVDNTLYYGMTDGNLYKRAFDGASLGTPSVVNPFSDPFWDSKTTGSGTSTYKGVKSGFYAEIPGISSMYYAGNGKLYYTRTGQNSLYWRWFTPDSGVTGSDEFTATGATGFSTAKGVLFISGSTLYYSTSNGNLNKIGWTGSTTTGSASVVSGPGVDGINWATGGSFIGN